MNVEKKIRELEERIEELEQSSEEFNTDQGLEDFVEKVEPESHQQCAVTIGYYHDVKNGKKFSMNEVSEGFLECRWSEYSNMRMLRSQLLNKKEWIREYGENEDGETIYILTKDGKEFVEGKLNEE
ncbi:MAG: hypothetical protein ABEJ95_03410 [Candidatus Nanohalobium sp.]